MGSGKPNIAGCFLLNSSIFASKVNSRLYWAAALAKAWAKDIGEDAEKRLWKVLFPPGKEASAVASAVTAAAGIAEGAKLPDGAAAALLMELLDGELSLTLWDTEGCVKSLIFVTFALFTELFGILDNISRPRLENHGCSPGCDGPSIVCVSPAGLMFSFAALLAEVLMRELPPNVFLEGPDISRFPPKPKTDLATKGEAGRVVIFDEGIWW